MDINNLPSNTDSYRDRDKTVEQKPETEEIRTTKVVSAPVTERKSGLRYVIRSVVSDDISNIRDNLMQDVLVPSIRDFAWNALNKAVDVVFGDGTSRVLSNHTPATRYSYSRSYDDRRDRDREESRRSRVSTSRRCDYRDVVLRTRRDAEDVIIALEQHIRKYGFASVSNFFEFCGMEDEYTDRKYGWTDISEAEVVRVHEGYLIKLPKALPID